MICARAFGLFLCVVLVSMKGVSQPNYGFEEGLIISKVGDTTRCFVEMAVTYGPKVGYKKTSELQVEYLSAKSIKAIVTSFKYLENIPVGKRELLMTRTVNGNTQLFLHVVMNEGSSQPGQGGSFQMYQQPTLTYVVKKAINITKSKERILRK